MSEKKGWGSRIWETLKGGKQISTEEAFSQTGIDIIKTRMLESRVEESNDFNHYFTLVIEKKKEIISKSKDNKDVTEVRSLNDATPEEKLDFMLESANGINEKLHRIAIPWLNAGDPGIGARVVKDWSGIYADIVVAIRSVKTLIEMSENENLTEFERAKWMPTNDKTTLVNKLEFLFDKIFIQAVLIVIGLAWKEKHTIPDKIAVIQNIPQERGVQQIRTKLPGANE